MKRIIMLALLCCFAAGAMAQTATIYIMRKSMLGAMVKFPITVNDMQIGKLGNKKYFKVIVPAGRVTIGAVAEKDDRITLDVRTGEKHYIQIQPKMGVIQARVNMMRMGAIDGEELRNKLNQDVAVQLDQNGNMTLPNQPNNVFTVPTESFQTLYAEAQEDYETTKQLLIAIAKHSGDMMLSTQERQELSTLNDMLSKVNNKLYQLSTDKRRDDQKIQDIIKVGEALGIIENRMQTKYGNFLASYEDKQQQSAPMVAQAAPMAQTNSMAVAPQAAPAVARRMSDVDINVPVTGLKAENTFVLVIANEDYQFVDKVQFALNDGEAFREYCIKTLGVPERQVWFYKNATAGIISGGVDKMLQAMSIFDNAKVIVYYCGHGIPDEKTGDAYIVPTDGQATNVATCYSLNKLYKTLASAKAESVTYFMDACFTGANRNGSMLVAARGVAREPKKEVIQGNTIVFSAASADETAMPFKEKQHGLFTYFLLKKLQETKGKVSYGELADYIKNNVRKEAFLTNEKPQNPMVATSAQSAQNWKNQKL